MKFFIMALVTVLAPTAFAAPIYYVNCTQAMAAVPEVGPVLSPEEIKLGLKSMNLDPDTAVPLFNALKTAGFYFLDKGDDLYLIVDKTSYESNADPSKGMTFGYGCALVNFYELLDRAKLRTEASAFYQLPADAELIEFQNQ